MLKNLVLFDIRGRRYSAVCSHVQSQKVSAANMDPYEACNLKLELLSLAPADCRHSRYLHIGFLEKVDSTQITLDEATAESPEAVLEAQFNARFGNMLANGSDVADETRSFGLLIFPTAGPLCEYADGSSLLIPQSGISAKRLEPGEFSGANQPLADLTVMVKGLPLECAAWHWQVSKFEVEFVSLKPEQIPAKPEKKKKKNDDQGELGMEDAEESEE